MIGYDLLAARQPLTPPGGISLRISINWHLYFVLLESLIHSVKIV